MTLTKVKLRRFTAFSNLELELCPGINVLVGANGTGKTHLMKVLYAACDSSKADVHFAEKWKLPLLGPQARPWPRPPVRSCGVFNIASWSNRFPQYPIRRQSAGKTHP